MDDRSGQVLGVAITFLVLTWITVGLRSYVRTCIVKGFGLDDQMMVVTLILYTAYLSCQIGGAAYGTGRHRKDITDANAEKALRFWYFCEIFYTLSTCVLKIAVGLFLLRITIIPIHIWIIRMIMVVACVLGCAYTSLVIFQCKPVSFWWDLNPDHTGSCLSPALVTNMTFAVSALNSFADWTFGILPIFIVKDLQMARRMKIVVAGVISLAAVGSTATIVRLPYTSTLKGYKGELLYRTTDFAIWTTVEVGIGITAGSIATLKPLIKSLRLASHGFSTDPSHPSRMPWSRPTASKLRDAQGQQLSHLKGNLITTTVTAGGKASNGSDEDLFLNPFTADSGINKDVETTFVVEQR